MNEEIASHDEVLGMLTEKARDGQTSAMIALERALRARKDAAEAEALDDELTRELDELIGRGRERE
jgi:hypothetical protein